MMPINAAGLNIIKSYEGILDGDPTTVNLDPYLCPAGVWTIGWGHAIRGKDGQLLRGQNNKSLAYARYPVGITKRQAEDLILFDVDDAYQAVSRYVNVDLTDNQFSALVSLVFNIGTGKFKNSDALKKLNLSDFVGACTELKGFRLVNGKVSNGLINRRAAEVKLFSTP